jgi:hypothetical protein
MYVYLALKMKRKVTEMNGSSSLKLVFYTIFEWESLHVISTIKIQNENVKFHNLAMEMTALLTTGGIFSLS